MHWKGKQINVDFLISFKLPLLRCCSEHFEFFTSLQDATNIMLLKLALPFSHRKPLQLLKRAVLNVIGTVLTLTLGHGQEAGSEKEQCPPSLFTLSG